MNLYFRFIFLILKRIFLSKKITIFEECKTSFLVHFTDLDLNFHMNNGVYLSIMDLGRMDLLIRSGYFSRLLFNGYYPVVASEVIRFKKSLSIFQHFEIVTYIDSWDEKDFYISQKFFSNNEIVAEGYIRGRFKKRGRKQSLSTEELFKVLNIIQEIPKNSSKSIGLSSIDSLLAVDEK